MLQKLPSVWGKHQDTEDQVYASEKKKPNFCTNQAKQSFLSFLVSSRLHSAQYESLTAPRSLLSSAVIPLCPFTAAGEAAGHAGWLGAAQQHCQVPNYCLCKTHPSLGLLKLPLIFIVCKNQKDFKALLLCLIWLRVASEVPARQKAAPQRVCYCNSLMAALTPLN